MDIVNGISFLLAVISLIGNYFVNKQKIVGFYIWIAANILWAILFYYTKIYGSAILMLIYIVFCVHGILSWKKINES